MPDDNDPGPDSWDQVPQNLWHRYRRILDDGSLGDLDRRARAMLLASGWRDPQRDVDEERAATTGYWWQNELVPMRIDQALVTGDQLEIVGYRTHDTAELRTLSDHLPLELTIRLHAGDALPAPA
jgi:exonuclease III